MITESKVSNFFCIADDFCKFYDAMAEKQALPHRVKRKCHRKSILSKAEVIYYQSYGQAGCILLLSKETVNQ